MHIQSHKARPSCSSEACIYRKWSGLIHKHVHIHIHRLRIQGVHNCMEVHCMYIIVHVHICMRSWVTRIALAYNIIYNIMCSIFLLCNFVKRLKLYIYTFVYQFPLDSVTSLDRTLSGPKKSSVQRGFQIDQRGSICTANIESRT